MPSPERLRELAQAAEPRAQLVEPFFLQPGGPGVTEVIVVRHAQVPASSTVEDNALTEVGREQAELLCDYLAEWQIDAIYASPSARTLQTIAPLASRSGLEVRALDGLSDIENRLPRDVSMPDALAREVGQEEATRRLDLMQREGWRLDLFGILLESSESLRGRTAAAIDSAIAAHPGGRIVVVTHGPNIAAYVSHVLDSDADFLIYPRLTSITVFMAKEERRQLLLLNATPHFGVL